MAPMAPVAAKLPADSDEEQASDNSADDAAEKRPRAQRKLAEPNRQMSPFDIRFSQMRARHEFRDAKLLEESAELIRAVRCEESNDHEAAWKLEAPFPPIEVLKWRCKLRDETSGRPLLDPETGEELWDKSDRWFTLDNRRLWCLQKAALKVHPERVRVDVIELPPGPMTRIRELKKFRTLDTGRSIFIGGRREGETLVRWSWREAAGLPPDDDDDENDDTCADSPTPASGSFDSGRVQLRQRKKYTSGGRGHDGRTGGRGSANGSRSKRHGAGASVDDDDIDSDDGGRFSQMSLSSLAVFVSIYLALRFGTKLFAVFSGRSGGEPATEAVQAAGDTHVLNSLLTGATAALLAAIIVHLLRRRLQ